MKLPEQAAGPPASARYPSVDPESRGARTAEVLTNLGGSWWACVFGEPFMDAKTLLLAFFRQVFEPTLIGFSRCLPQSYMRAIERFRDCLNAEPELGQLTTENLDAVRKFVLEKGATRNMATTIRKRLSKLASEAAKHGFIETRSKGRGGREYSYKRSSARPAPGTIRHFMETVYVPQQLLGRSAKSIQDLDCVAAALSEHYQRDILISEQTNELAAEHFQWLMARGLSPKAVNRHRSVWFAAWRLCCERELHHLLPKVRRVRETRDAPDAWTADELRAMIEAAEKLDCPPIGGVPSNRWWPAVLLTAYYTALRRRSLLGLRRIDLDLRTGWLNVPGQLVKNGVGIRRRLGKDCLQAIIAMDNRDNELLFPRSDDPRNLSRQFGYILRNAKIAPSTRKTGQHFHKLRRSTATITAVVKGLSAACDLLGHSSEYVTKLYIDPSKLPDHDATAYLPRLFQNPEETRTREEIRAEFIRRS